MAFRKDRVRIVLLYKAPKITAQSFEQPVEPLKLDSFLKLPIVQKNVLKLDVVRPESKVPSYSIILTCHILQVLANGDLDQTIQSLGVPKSTMNLMVILEAEVNT